jgi:hypothetical protein
MSIVSFGYYYNPQNPISSSNQIINLLKSISNDSIIEYKENLNELLKDTLNERDLLLQNETFPSPFEAIDYLTKLNDASLECENAFKNGASIEEIEILILNQKKFVTYSYLNPNDNKRWDLTKKFYKELVNSINNIDKEVNKCSTITFDECTRNMTTFTEYNKFYKIVEKLELAKKVRNNSF